MDILPLNFGACKLGGVWYEDDSFLVPKLIYRCIVLFMVVQFTLSQMIELTRIKGDVIAFTETSFMFFSFFTLCLKLLNFLSRQDEMNSLINNFRSELFQSKSFDEREIIKNFSSKVARLYIFYICFTETSGLVLIVTPLLVSLNSGKLNLPFMSYQTYEISNEINFKIAYFSQSLTLIYGVFLNISMDCLCYGFIIMVTGQYELNGNRLKNSTMSIKDCIQHHLLMHDTLLKIQNFYIRIIAPFFFISLMTLCNSVFLLSQKNVFSLSFFSLTSYLSCILIQLFFYCWFGNELKLKMNVIIDAIYSSNWLDCSAKEKRNMWFIMLSSQMGSAISFHGQCSLTINTFLWIAKTSYAAFNLLQRVSIGKVD